MDRITRDWFNVSMSVKSLLLIDLGVLMIDSGAFKMEQFEELKELKIVNCPIRSLPSETFDGLGKLQILALINVKIFKFEAKILQFTPKLTEFTMIDCVNQEIALNNLFGTSVLSKLKKITVSNCNLNGTINDSTFVGLRAIMELRLPQNRIETITKRAFYSLFGTLKSLHLNKNQLKTLPNGIFHIPSTSNIMIYLNENPWHCDCHMESLRLYVQKPENDKFPSIICASPLELAGTAMKSQSSLCAKPPPLAMSTVYLMPEPQSASPDKKNQTETSKLVVNPPLNSPKIKDFQFLPQLKVQCALSNTQPPHNMHLNIHKPTIKSLPSLQRTNNKFMMYTLHLAIKCIYFGYEQSTSTRSQRPICIGNFKGGRVRKKDIDIKPNKLYRFCRMESDSNVVNPFECIPFYSKSIEENSEISPWIMAEQKTVIILAFVVVLMLIPIITMVMSIVAIKHLRRVRRRRRSENIRLTLDPMDAEAIKRLRLVLNENYY